jgi:tRNA G18 (ribose-2'-O)-methylase SpoU
MESLRDISEYPLPYASLTLDPSLNGSDPITPEEVDVDAAVVFVLGNEGAGLSKDVANACDVNVVIDQFIGEVKVRRVRSTRYNDNAPDDEIEHVNESLNVGVATGILLHAVSSRRIV